MIGLEPTLEEHLEKLVAVFREVRRVLRDDGTLWLNYGDGYWGGKGQSSQAWSARNMDRDTLQKDYHHIAGKGETRPTDRRHDLFKPKDLIMMPARVAMALHADGWWVRSEIIYAKKNCMPESVTDRPTSSHEKIFLMTKSHKYFYDAMAVRVAGSPNTHARRKDGQKKPMKGTEENDNRTGTWVDKRTIEEQAAIGTNLRNVWHLATHSYPGNHWATFPPVLVETCIKAGTSEECVCSACGAPSIREVRKRGGTTGRSWHNHEHDQTKGNRPDDRTMASAYETGDYQVESAGWKDGCECKADKVPATVLDCFGGSGTTGLVADRMQRNAILIEINREYCEMAQARLLEDAPMFTDVLME